MKKRHVIHLLSDYLDNLLPEAQRQQVDNHLSSCRHCRSKLQQLQNYQQLLLNLERKPAPEEIRAKVMERVESRPQQPDSRLRTRVAGTRKLETGGWQLAAGIAAIIILLVLTIPKQWFMPGTVSSDVISVVQKKQGKGGAVRVGGVFLEERGEKGEERIEKREERGESDIVDLRLSIIDFRLSIVIDIIEDVDGKILMAELNSSEDAYSRIVVGLKKKNYKAFAEKYNELGMGETLPEKAGFSISNNVIVNLFPVKRNFYATDYNEDGYCDMILQYTAGRLEGQWFVAINNHMGNFYPPIEIPADSLPPATIRTDSSITFIGDFNGDGKIDFGTKYLEGEFISQFHLSLSMDDGGYSNPIPFRFGTGVMAWQGNYTHYFGDFNADGLTDLLTKEGGGDALGLWYLMLNNGSLGFGSTEQVKFGGSDYLISSE